jgi:CRP-like cAMP-binding protein
MYLKQSDLFWQLDHDFVKRIMDMSVKEKHAAGDILFHQGDPARHFYMLIKGRVRLATGEDGRMVHTVSHGGECFGWSALVGREVYSASAECREPCSMILFEGDRVNQIVEADPANGVRFMKRLARMLGSRLIQNYQSLAGASSSETLYSYGTGQVAESPAETQ